MKTLLFTIASVITLNSFSQAPSIQWKKNMEGSFYDGAYSIKQTADGGYISTGSSNSSNGDFTGNKGDMDGWVAKLDASGITQWKKNLGGSSQDQLYTIVQTSDGDFVAAGYTKSNDGDISGYHGTPQNPSADDCFIIKLDANGNTLWERTLGGSNTEQIWSVKETTDGGCIMTGTSNSIDGDVSNLHGTGTYSDYWVVKLDVNGNIQWQNSFGGSENDYSSSVIQTTDGGYIVTGVTTSTDGDVLSNTDPNYFSNCWVVKLNANGIITWEKSYLVDYGAEAKCIQQTSDGGYVIAGSTTTLSDMNGLIIKLDNTGTLQWQKTYGGSAEDKFSYIEETSNGQYIIAGTTFSNDGDANNNYGGYGDCWIVNTDVNGNILWQKNYGGSGDDVAYSIHQTNDNGFILSTYTSSTDFDVTNNYGSYDAWIVKFNPLSVGIEEKNKNEIFSLYPNPAKDVISINIANKISASFYITNAIGEQVLSGNIDDYNNQINISNLTSGMYFIQLDGQEKQSYKFIKK